MLSFISFSRPTDSTYHQSTRHHPDVEDLMDVDDDDFTTGSEPRLTCPGETITSSQAFMR
jgi:exosome complex component RRP4